MARIVVLSQFFPPETFSGANRVGALVAALAAEHEVVVVTLRPSYPDPSLYPPSAVASNDASLAYRVKRSLQFQPHSGSLVVRALRETTMALRLAVQAAGERAEVVLTSSPSMFLAPASWILARGKGARFVWDVRDLNWQYAAESSLISPSSRLAAALLERFMWLVARNADLVAAATAGSKRAFVAHGVPESRVLVVPNSVGEELLDACAGCDEHVQKARPLVSYVGLIGEPQGLGVVLDVARLVPEADFVLAGDGMERASLERRARRSAATNVSFTGYLSRPQVLDLYRRSDVLFAQLKDAPTLNEATIPSKIYEYMATGKPIVYAGKGLAAEAIETAGCGLPVPPSDAAAIGEAVRTLLGDPEAAAAMGRSGRRFIEQSAHREDVMRAFEAAIAQLPRLG